MAVGAGRARNNAPPDEVLCGRNAVREALRAGRRRIYWVLIGEGAREAGTLADIVALCGERGVTVERVPPRILDSLATGLPHQGVVARVSAYRYAQPEQMLAAASERGEPPLLLLLDALQDPQNVGSLLRTAEAVGVHGVLLPQRRAVAVTPAVSRASAGAVEHLPVAQVTNLVPAIAWLREQGLWVWGVEHRTNAVDYMEADLTGPLALVLGGEGQGLRRLVAERCDALVRLPMRGRVGSLNVAVAGSVLLYRVLAARQRPAGCAR